MEVAAAQLIAHKTKELNKDLLYFIMSKNGDVAIEVPM